MFAKLLAPVRRVRMRLRRMRVLRCIRVLANCPIDDDFKVVFTGNGRKLVVKSLRFEG